MINEHEDDPLDDWSKENLSEFLRHMFPTERQDVKKPKNPKAHEPQWKPTKGDEEPPF